MASRLLTRREAEAAVQGNDVGSSPGPGAGVIKGISKSAERKVAQEPKVLVRVCADCVLPAIGEPTGIYESCCKGAMPVLDIDVAGVIINFSDGAEKMINGLAHQ